MREVERYSHKIRLVYSFCTAFTTVGYCAMGIAIGVYTTYFSHEPEWKLPVNMQ